MPQPPAAEQRDTRGALRLRAAPLLASALAGDGTRASRCRSLRALASTGRPHRRELALMVLMHALGERDPDVRVAALDGLRALATRAPRLRARIADVLARSAPAPSRSTAVLFAARRREPPVAAAGATGR